MRMIHAIPRVLQRNMVLSIPMVLLLGFGVGLFYDTKSLQFLVFPLTIVMIYPTMVGINFKQLFSKGDTTLQVSALLMNFVLTPLIAYALGWVFFSNEPLLHLGFFLTGLLPTSGMTLSWTQMASGNLPAAVKMTIIGLVVGALLTPIYLMKVFGASVDVPLLKTLQQIVFIVFVPLAMGFATQRLLLKRYGKNKFVKDLKPLFGPWGTIGVLGVQFLAISLKSKDILDNPRILLLLGLPVLLFFVINFVLSTFFARFAKTRENGVAFIYGTVLGNLSIALALVMTVFGAEASEAALLISMGFIFQAQLAAWHVKLLKHWL